MNSTLTLVISIFALGIALLALFASQREHYQIASAGNVIYRLETRTGKISAYHMASNTEVEKTAFLVEVAATP